MNTFRNKQFKNELDPKYAFYDCLRSCEIKISLENSLEEYIEKCDWNSAKSYPRKKIKKGLIKPQIKNKRRFFFLNTWHNLTSKIVSSKKSKHSKYWSFAVKLFSIFCHKFYSEFHNLVNWNFYPKNIHTNF